MTYWIADTQDNDPLYQKLRDQGPWMFPITHMHALPNRHIPQISLFPSSHNYSGTPPIRHTTHLEPSSHTFSHPPPTSHLSLAPLSAGVSFSLLSLSLVGTVPSALRSSSRTKRMVEETVPLFAPSFCRSTMAIFSPWPPGARKASFDWVEVVRKGKGRRNGY